MSVRLCVYGCACGTLPLIFRAANVLNSESVTGISAFFFTSWSDGFIFIYSFFTLQGVDSSPSLSHPPPPTLTGGLVAANSEQ